MVCFFHLPFYAQIRKYIGIVRPEYNSETVSFLKAFQNELKAKGYNAYANYIDGYLKGRFGSGFVYVNSEGKNFVMFFLKACNIPSKYKEVLKIKMF